MNQSTKLLCTLLVITSVFVSSQGNQIPQEARAASGPADNPPQNSITATTSNESPINPKPSFLATEEVEMEQLLKFLQKLHPQVSEQKIRDILSSEHTQKAFADSVCTLQEQKNSILQNCTNKEIAQNVSAILQDISDTLDALKQRMNIPQEVELLILHHPEAPAFYNSFERKMYITPLFLSFTPSMRLFVLIHELTHTQQHMREGLVEMGRRDRGDILYRHEKQADTQAARAISCPICMQIIEDEWPADTTLEPNYLNDIVQRTELGYLSKKDFAAHKANKNPEDVCDAHKAITQSNQELQKLCPYKVKSINIFQKYYGQSKQAFKRMVLDWQAGCMLDRLSTVKLP